MSMTEHDRKWRAEKEQERRWLTWRVSPVELQEFRQLFKQIDTDNDGFISGEEESFISLSFFVYFHS